MVAIKYFRVVCGAGRRWFDLMFGGAAAIVKLCRRTPSRGRSSAPLPRGSGAARSASPLRQVRAPTPAALPDCDLPNRQVPLLESGAHGKSKVEFVSLSRMREIPRVPGDERLKFPLGVLGRESR